MNVLMVCLGNICRSPMADGLLRKKVELNQLQITVDSAGTASYHIGKAPDSRMCQTAISYGCNIKELRARQFVQEDFEKFDLIYVMDSSNYNNVMSLARNDVDRAKVDFILNEVYPGENRNVPDPYYGGKEEFIDVYELLDEATDRVIQKISIK